jgi:SAM-dependent methyltransferase
MEINGDFVKRFIEQRPDLNSALDKNDRVFAIRCYDADLNGYVDRIKAIDFKGAESVLDLACGFGQWTWALSQLNEHVTGLDLAQSRLAFCGAMAGEMGLGDKTRFVEGSMVDLPFEEYSFDSVFCYGALMFCDENQVLRQIAKVLKPGGKAYVMGTGLGLYLHYILDRFLRQGRAYYLRGAAVCIGNTVLGRRSRPHYTSQRRIKEAVEGAGLELVKFAAEGTINFNRAEPKPNYQGQYYGQLGVFEFICKKGE